MLTYPVDSGMFAVKMASDEELRDIFDVTKTITKTITFTQMPTRKRLRPTSTAARHQMTWH